MTATGMMMKTVCHKIICIITVCMALAACGSDSTAPVAVETRGGVRQDIERENNQACALIKDQLKLIIADDLLASWMLADPQFTPLIDDMLARVSYYTYTTRQINYTSEDAQGRLIQLSGLLIHPEPKPGQSLPALPILSIQHATQTVSGTAPSMDINSFQVKMAGVMACSGYAVLMPDYEGFGISTTMHPYVVSKPLTNSVIDLIRGVRNLGNNKKFVWNNKLYLMGFSEGGFVTMATAREIQENLSSELNVSAVAPLEGPYDLSGTMRNVMMTDDTFIAPFFLPDALLGYYHAYNDPVFSPDFTMKAPYNTTVPPLFDGTHGMTEINRALPKIPKQILTDAALNQMSRPDSQITSYLYNNNAYRWTPRMPMMLFHHTNDEIVPYNNATIAKTYFDNAGATSVQLHTLTFPSPLPDTLPVHVTGFGPILMKGFLWIDDQNRK
ncbi:MAG: lipase family protein [Syntrophales bacterium]